jgi:hypothetical protein
MSATTAVHDEPQQAGDAPPPRAYQYKHGDRPLDGFTIQRGAGRGGFGEVYYAISDSGREVALKVIQTYEQIELRGISQCMNLKSPHLVTVFDVKYGSDGKPWVIMEYVGGPSLRQILDVAPSGLGTQKAAFFLREIAKGLSYLHECGIVHRDLKPANIFYENGYVKIGDYGLSKAISTSHHSGQTVTVGTVHYMAPEIGAGNYDRGIDIYALGALLYEMLTGQVPFFGSSTAEVLMKHLSAEVDTNSLEEPFRTVVRKAMAKNPAERYQSVQEMVEAVFGAEHIRDSVSAFTPDSLTMVAGYAAQKLAGGQGQGSGSFTPSDAPAPDQAAGSWQCDRWGAMAGVMDRFAARAEKRRVKWERRRAKWEKPNDYVDPFRSVVGDPLRAWHRLVLSAIATFIVAMVAGLTCDHHGVNSGEAAFVAFMSTAWATGMAMVAWYYVAPALRNESPWLTRLAVGGMAGTGAILFSLPFWGDGHEIGGTALGVFITFLLLDWRERLSPNRPERVMIGKLITAAVVALILTGMCGGMPQLGIIIAVGTTLTTGIAAPWSRQRPRGFPVQPVGQPRSPISPPVIPPIARNADFGPRPAPSPGPVVPPPIPNLETSMVAPIPANTRRVPRAIRGVWLGLFVGFATLGLFLLLMLLADSRHMGHEDRALMSGFGSGLLIFAAFALRRGRRLYYNGIWQYFFRPIIQLLCVQAILLSSSFLLFGRMSDGDKPPAIFFLVFPTILLFVLTFFTGRGGSMTQAPALAPVPLPSHYPASHEGFSVGGLVFGFGRLIFNLAGSAVLLFSLLVGLACTAHLPDLFKLDPDFAREMEQNFNSQNWPSIMVHIGAAISFVTAMIATGLLLLPRRHFGAAHMFRAIIGIGAMFGAILVLGHALPAFENVPQGEVPGITFDNYLKAVQMPGVFMGGILTMFGIFMLLWPTRKAGPIQQVNYNVNATPTN